MANLAGLGSCVEPEGGERRGGGKEQRTWRLLFLSLCLAAGPRAELARGPAWPRRSAGIIDRSCSTLDAYCFETGTAGAAFPSRARAEETQAATNDRDEGRGVCWELEGGSERRPQAEND